MKTFLKNAGRVVAGLVAVTAMGALFCKFAGISLIAAPVVGVAALVVMANMGD